MTEEAGSIYAIYGTPRRVTLPAESAVVELANRTYTGVITEYGYEIHDLADQIIDILEELQLGLIKKRLFGRNSAVKSTTIVESRV